MKKLIFIFPCFHIPCLCSLILTLLISIFPYFHIPCLHAVTSTSTVAGVYVKNPSTLIIDDWDDGVPPNNLGAPCGCFNIDGGVAKEIIVSTVAVGGSGCSLQINYDVTSNDQASGYWTRFHYSLPRNLTGYKYLSFYVKGEVGGEFFKVELSTGEGGWKSRVYINDYLDGGVTTAWQKVTIPLDNFANIVDWTKIFELTFGFEHTAAMFNNSSYTGTVYIDNLVVGSDAQPICRLDHYGDKLGTNSVGGETGDCRGNGYFGATSGSHVFVSTQGHTSPNSLQINYGLDSIGSGYAGCFSIVGGTTTYWGGVQHDFSNYDKLSLWIKAEAADKNPRYISIELKQGTTTYGACVFGITTEWKNFLIPLSYFTTDYMYVNYSVRDHGFGPPISSNGSKVSEFTFIISNISTHPDSVYYGSIAGTVYIDDVQFVNSSYAPDVTSPSVPTNLKLINGASGGTTIENGTQFGCVNWITCTADNGIQDPTLESVRFEYRPTGGSWTTIKIDYDLADTAYSAYWDTFELSEAQTYELRAIAKDTSGNETAMVAKTGLTVKHYPDISTLTDDQLLDTIQKQIFWYYWTEGDTNRGLVQDRVRNFQQDTYGYTSVAAAGLGLVAICIAHQRGWVSTTDAYNRVYTTLNTYFNSPESSEPSDPMLVRHNGFYYHYTNFGGARSAGSELSTIDTAIFISGALYAGKYFKNLGYSTLWDYADQMYRRVDWNWMLNGNNYLDWGWTPESGFNQGDMSGYSECILAYILGIGSPESSKKLPSAAGWNALTRPMTSYKGIDYIFEQSLFTHQYPQLFVNMQGKKDANGWCYATNTFDATIHHHKYCYDNRLTYSTYGENSWGLGGADGPSGYHHYGIGSTGADQEDGTIALSNLFTAITERSTQVTKAMRELYTVHTSTLWGKYAFCDSYNTQGAVWRNSDVVGVQQGAVMLAIENYRSGNSIKNTFTNISYIQDAFSRLGFVSDTVSPGKITGLTGSTVSGEVALSWVATGDDNYTGNISSGVYEVRFSTVNTNTWDTAPTNYLNYNIIWSTGNVVRGSKQSKGISELNGNTTYYFYIKTTDDSFNWSPVSDTTSYYFIDATPPFTITNLSALTGTLGGEVKLSWTTPGDDGIVKTLSPGSEYRIQHSSWPNWQDIKWSTANAQISISTSGINQGVTVSRVVNSLIEGTNYYFRIWTKDEANNWSTGLSNGATAMAKVVDITPPFTITNLSALTGANSGEIKLSWTTPGDDGITGTLPSGSEYRIQRSSWPNWQDIKWSTADAQISISTSGINQGMTVGTVVDSLIPGTTYFFRIWTRDEAANWSGLSNGATAPANNWILWDDCDSRVWWGDDWSTDAGWYAPSSVSTVTFQGRKCIKAYWSQSDAWGGWVRTDWVFPNENWELPVIGFKADVYAVTNWSNGFNIELEPRNNAFTTIELVGGNNNLNTNVWNTCSWTFTSAMDYSVIGGFVFKIHGLANAPATVYLDNLRLITTSGDVVWDNMDDCSNNWGYGGDYVAWSTYSNRKEPITHNYACPVSSAASVFLQWNAANSTDPYAKVTSGGNLNADWSGYKSIRVWARCSSTTNNIKVSFWDGATGQATSVKQVPVANTWTQLMWNLPTGIVWTSVDSIEFIVETNSGASTGTLYIDHIEFSDKVAQ